MKRKIKVGDEVIFQGERVTVVSTQRGGKTNKVVMHSGIMPNGFQSRPRTYKLSNGYNVRGNKLKTI